MVTLPLYHALLDGKLLIQTRTMKWMMATEHTRKRWKAKALHRREQSHPCTRNGSALSDEQMIDPAALSPIETEDPWNLPPLVWSQIGRNMYDSHSTIPTQFGEAPRDFWEHSHHLKAAEWKNFAFLFLPVYLKLNLPDDDYAAFMELMDCIKITTVTGTSITLENIEDVRKRLAKFNQYYEARCYNHDYDRLAACLAVFHQLAHIADFLEFLGPMWAYSQWCMERMCGISVKYAKNKFWANRYVLF
jgi:hypothetical protein